MNNLFTRVKTILVEDSNLKQSLRRRGFSTNFNINHRRIMSCLAIPIPSKTMFTFTSSRFLLKITILLRRGVRQRVRHLNRHFRNISKEVSDVIFSLTSRKNNSTYLFHRSTRARPPLNPMFLGLLSSIRVSRGVFLAIMFTTTTPTRKRAPRCCRCDVFNQRSRITGQ